MEEDLEGLGVGGHDNELADAAVEGLGRLVGSFLELAVVRGLLHDIQDLLSESRVCEGEGYDTR